MGDTAPLNEQSDFMKAADDMWTHVQAASRLVAQAEKEALNDSPESAEAFTYIGDLHMRIAEFKHKVYTDLFGEGGEEDGEVQPDSEV